MTSLVVQWLKLQASNAEGPGSIPGLELDPASRNYDQRSHMPN